MILKTNGEDYNIFGGFKLKPWKIEENNYQGDNESYIFSLYPKYRNYFALNDDKSQPFYCSLSSSGLG